MLTNVRETFLFFLRPVRIIRTYQRSNLRPDLLAGLTVAVILLPQAIVYALIAELPPHVGLYSAIVAAIVGGLWGSSNHLQTGPTNTASLLVLAVLLPIAASGTPEYLVAAGLLAVLVGAFRLALGLARLGILANFVSDSVIVGFAAGAGVLISVNQLRYLFRLDFHGSPYLVNTVQSLISNITEAHWISTALGLGTVLLIIITRKLNAKLPGALLSMVAAAAVVGIFRLDREGVSVIGHLSRGLPPFSVLPILDFELIGKLSTGALAIAAIGLVEAMSIARSIAGQTGQRLDGNQEFVGQGLANIFCGFFSGYATSGSFLRSTVNFNSGGKTALASVFSGIFILAAMNIFAPFAAYVPRAALAGVLILTAYRMVDRQRIVRIWRGAGGDAAVMAVTFLATLFLHLEFAVLTGTLLSLVVYILKTSVPRVIPVLPDDKFKHFVSHPGEQHCPQLSIINISGDLYFGAVNHIEKSIHQNMVEHPEQRFLLLRMHMVNQCDMSGIHVLENVLANYRKMGGDIFFVRVDPQVMKLFMSSGFLRRLGKDNILPEDRAIDHIYHKILDPAICIYECPVRAFRECQNLPKHEHSLELPFHTEKPEPGVPGISCQDLRARLRSKIPPLVIDVREPREYKQSHIPGAELFPLPVLLSEAPDLPMDRHIVLVCRGGRRSTRATSVLHSRGYKNAAVLEGGMLAWETAGYLIAVGEL